MGRDEPAAMRTSWIPPPSGPSWKMNKWLGAWHWGNLRTDRGYEGVSRTWKLISWKDFNVALLTIVNRYNQAQTQTQQKNTVLSGGLFLLKLVKGMVLLPGMQHVSNSHMKFSEAMCESSMFISNTITIITTITAITIITIITVTAITAITSITSIPSAHPWPAPSPSS